jgi:hypothetical protein
MNGFIAAIQPALVTLVLAIVGGCTALATAYLRCLTNKMSEKEDRAALHSALLSGARSVTNHGQTLEQSMASVQEYARRSVPDAFKNLNPPPDVLAKLTLAKINEAAAEVNPLPQFR